MLNTLDYLRQVVGVQVGGEVERQIVGRELADVALCTHMQAVDEEIAGICRGKHI